tara:strand:+ start:499 stop:1077 length:579 start_codon:yes stop_codon:yes gene_type:complete
MISDFISAIDDAVSVEYCEKWIKYIEHYIEHGFIHRESYDSCNRDHHTINFHNDFTYDMLSGDLLPTQFLPEMKKHVSNYLEQYSVLKKESILMHDVKAKKIPVGGGFHEWHYENGGLQMSPRKLVVQLYLNTVHEGGETEFLYMNKRVKAKQGRLIIFPAAFTHTHRGNPPIGQEKYILTTWLNSQSMNWT